MGFDHSMIGWWFNFKPKHLLIYISSKNEGGHKTYPNYLPRHPKKGKVGESSSEWPYFTILRLAYDLPRRMYGSLSEIDIDVETVEFLPKERRSTCETSWLQYGL